VPARGNDRRGGAPSQPRSGGSGGVGGGHPHHGRPQGGPDARTGSGPRSVGGGGGGGGGAGSGRYNGAPQKLPEFDFEKANSKFDKEKIKEEVLKGVVHVETESSTEGELAPAAVPAEKAYDKSTSFFDSISCESLDRLKDDDGGGNARSDRRRHERSLNAETFGRAANDRRTHHRGGPRRYGPPGPHQAHGGAPGGSAGGNNQPMDNRPARGGYSSGRGGYAAAVRGSSAPQKRFVPVGQNPSSPVVGH
jgi:protein LSM14